MRYSKYLSPYSFKLLPISSAYFLKSRPIIALPDPDIMPIQEPNINRYERIQRMQEHFWRGCFKDYTIEFQQQFLWSQNSLRIKVNPLVFIKDNNFNSLSFGQNNWQSSICWWNSLSGVVRQSKVLQCGEVRLLMRFSMKTNTMLLNKTIIDNLFIFYSICKAEQILTFVFCF